MRIPRPRTSPHAPHHLGRAGILAIIVLGSLAGCSSSSATPATTSPSTTSSTASPRPAITTACHRPISSVAVVAAPVPGTPTDWSVTSFDGTVIRAHWFPVATYVPSAAGTTHPTVLMGPGWSLSGDTDVTGTGILGALPIRNLLDAGYNVLTWDPRGFGKSTGQAEVDSPAYEAKDVSVLMSWVAAQPGVQLDAPGDPRMGMVGGSYGGGIQLVTAAADCRVDAIVPTIAWNSLATSLGKARTVKIGWSGILTNLSTTAHVDPVVQADYAAGKATGAVSDAELTWFGARGPAQLLAKIHAPTLIIQGTVDTLFSLQEGVDNYEVLRAGGVTTSMQWFCGGHGVCLTSSGNVTAPEQATLAWLKRYVQRDTSVDTGPGFTFLDQNGTSYSAPSYPVAQGQPFTASGSGTLPLVSTGGAGPLPSTPDGQQLGGLVAPITPGPAANAVNVAVPFTRSGVIVGAPRLQMTYKGTVPDGVRPTRVFAQLVDTTTGFVLGNQITPIAVTLDGASHTASVPLEIVAYAATSSSHVELQLAATTVAYALPRLGGSVVFSAIHLTLPVAANLTTQG